MSSYDHQTKAGNEGDLVKHPALVAALLGLLTDQRAGFAVHFRKDLVVYAIDHRRLERGLLRKAGHSVIRCGLLYTNLMPPRSRGLDWGYW